MLNLRDTKISDTGVGYLANSKKLKNLDLSETNSPGVTDASGPHFANMTELTQLNLWSTQVSDECVRGIIGLKKVNWLNLDKTRVTNEGIKLLSSMPQLEWLHIGSNDVTDEVVPTLSKLGNLKYLNISFTRISEDGFFELDDQLMKQGCKVVGP
jgi:Leucine-rich repeat (LRR) protein